MKDSGLHEAVDKTDPERKRGKAGSPGARPSECKRRGKEDGEDGGSRTMVDVQVIWDHAVAVAARVDIGTCEWQSLK